MGPTRDLCRLYKTLGTPWDPFWYPWPPSPHRRLKNRLGVRDLLSRKWYYYVSIFNYYFLNYLMYQISVKYIIFIQSCKFAYKISNQILDDKKGIVRYLNVGYSNNSFKITTSLSFLYVIFFSVK